MKILNVQQGSDDWKRERAKRFTASEAAAVFGEHKYMSRADLQYQKKCQPEQDISPAQQKRFDDGHAAEAAARPIAEGVIDDELFPVTGVADDDDRFLASLDGLTMNGRIGFEHKWLNGELAAAVEAQELPEHYKWQMDHQMMVSEKTEKILFMASQGTEETAVWMWYQRDEDRIKRLIAGWDQFEKDLADYEPPRAKQEVIAKTPENLPALHIEVTGMVKASNLDEFKDHAMEVLGNINRDLKTDEDFATAESTVKWCSGVESRLDAAKDNALSQTADIYELMQTIDYVREETRKIRLALNRDVQNQKQQRKDEIVRAGRDAFDAHIRDLNKGFPQPFLSTNSGSVKDPDFASAIKNRSKLDKIQSAVDDELAKAKVEANQVAELIQDNLKQLDEHAPDHRFLFNDLDRIATKAPEDFAAIVKQRVSEYEQAEQERREREEQERIEREERERQQREAAESQQANQTESAPSQQEQITEAHSQSQELFGKAASFQPGNLGEDLREDDYFYLAEIIGDDALDDLRYDEDGNEYVLTIEVRRKSIKPKEQAA